MAYRITGHSTEFCSCNATCPCAFGLPPDHGRCDGIFAFHIESGQANGVDLKDTYVLLCASFGPGPWTAGGFKAALVLDTNASAAQRCCSVKKNNVGPATAATHAPAPFFRAGLL